MKVYLHFTNTTIQDIARVFHAQSIKYYEDEVDKKIYASINQLPIVDLNKLKQSNESYIPLVTSSKLYAYVINEEYFKHIKVGLSPHGTVEYINGSKKLILTKNFNELLYVTHRLQVQIGNDELLSFNKCFLVFMDKLIDEKYHSEIIPVVRPYEQCNLLIGIDLELSKRLKEGETEG